jgi:hypothetical protein
VHCLVEKLATYALGRGLARRDRAAVDGIVKSLPADPTFEDLVQAIVHSDMFRQRGAEEKRP